jgi:hypothetical protein
MHLESLAALSPRGTSSCEILLAGGASGLWARNVTGVDYHRVFLPAAACASAHCAPRAAVVDAERPLRQRALTPPDAPGGAESR